MRVAPSAAIVIGVLSIYSSDPVGNPVSAGNSDIEDKTRILARGCIESIQNTRRLMIYRPRLQFSCMLLVFVATARRQLDSTRSLIGVDSR